MTLAEALDHLNNAAFCVTLAFCLLCLYFLSLAWDHANANPPSGHWCVQHGMPRHECREQHRD